MGHLIVVGSVLLSPALLAGSLLFPFYWIGQFRLLRTTGSWALQRERHERWSGIFLKAILTAYVVIGGALLLPEVFPRGSAFLMSGGMFVVVGLLAANFAIVAAYPPDKAVELWKASEADRRP